MKPQTHLFRTLRVAGLAIAFASGLGRAFAEEKPADAALIEQSKKAALLSARLDDPQSKEEFENLTRKIAPNFQEVPINEKFGTNRFVKVTLNRNGSGFDGIRFKAPEGGDREMVWVFGYPTNAAFSGWYILEMKDPMQGFRNYLWSHGDGGRPLDQFAPWGRLEQEHHSIIQYLYGGHIKPGREYVVWFRFNHARSVDFFVALNLLTREEIIDKSTGAYVDSERALGINRGW